MKFCAKCGKELMDEAVVCPHCGCAVGGEYKKEATPVNEQTTKKGWIPLTCGIVALVYGILLLIAHLSDYRNLQPILLVLYNLSSNLGMGITGTVAIVSAIPLFKKKSAAAIVGFCLGVIGVFMVAVANFSLLGQYYNYFY